MDHSCNQCRHCKRNDISKGQNSWIYARCINPKLREGGSPHFCCVQIQHYGQCFNHKFYEPLAQSEIRI